MSVSDYCGKIKHLADILRDVGSPLTDQEMVISLLGSLSDKLAHCTPTISASRPPMRFGEARSFLQQEEVWVADRAQKVASTALLSMSRPTTTTTTAPAGGSTSSPTATNAGDSFGGDRPRKRKKQYRRTGGAGAQQGSVGAQQGSANSSRGAPVAS